MLNSLRNMIVYRPRYYEQRKHSIPVRNMSPILLHMNATALLRCSTRAGSRAIPIPIRPVLSLVSPSTSIPIGRAHI